MSDQFDLLDVLAGRDDIEDARTARRHGYLERRAASPDGRVLAKGQTWCGRCGQTVREFEMVNNHDLGYCGCPADVDPTFSRYPAAPGFRNIIDNGTVRHLLTEDELCDRWDRRYFADCSCGHPWGLHEDNDFCLAWWCGCRAFDEGFR